MGRGEVMPRSFTRRSARVEAMRLDSDSDVFEAVRWLAAHGVESARSFVDPRLVIFAPESVRVTALLGQWLTRNPDTGEFAVFDDGDEPGQFGWEHRSITGVQP